MTRIGKPTTLNENHQLSGVPEAHSMRVMSCGSITDGGCGHPHLIFFDSKGDPIAHGVVGPKTLCFLMDWVKAPNAFN